MFQYRVRFQKPGFDYNFYLGTVNEGKVSESFPSFSLVLCIVVHEISEFHLCSWQVHFIYLQAQQFRAIQEVSRLRHLCLKWKYGEIHIRRSMQIFTSRNFYDHI